MFETIQLISHVLVWFVCLAMIVLILLQGGAGDLSSAFGGGGMLDSTLGVGASKKMAKVTGWFAGAFFLLVLTLAIPYKGTGFGGARDAAPPAASTAPITPSTSPDAVQPPATTSTPSLATDPATPASSSPTIAIPDIASQAVTGSVSAAVSEAQATLDQAAASAATSISAAVAPAVEAVKPVIDAIPGSDSVAKPAH